MDTRTMPQSPPVRTNALAVVTPRRKRTAVAVLALIAAALIAWQLLAPAPIRTEFAPLVTGPMQVSIGNQGQVRVHDKYVLAAPVAGRVARSRLEDGDAVSGGDLLATLYPLPMDPRQREQAEARLASAKALAREAELRGKRAASDLQLATSERARIDRLVAERFVSPQAMDKAQAAESAARAEADAALARSQAARADIRAAEAALIAADNAGDQHPLALASPVAGYVLKVHERSERTVPAGTPLVSVGDPAGYEIVMDVLSTDAVKIRPGQAMWLDDWGGGAALHAVVRRVEPVAFTKISALGVEEQRVNVIGKPVEQLGPLGDGYRVEARVVIWEGAPVATVPGSAVFRVGDAWHVFAVQGKRIAERPVGVGQRNQDRAEILSGLAPGAVVVRFPGNQMKDGMRVEALR